jgi:voltage-gated potassium channel
MIINRTKKTYEVIFAVMAVTSALLIFDTGNKYIWLDRFILIIFAVDVFWRFYKAENKWTFIKRHPFEFISIIPFDSIFRIARLVRLMRILRVFGYLNRYFPTLMNILKTNNLDKMIGSVIILILVSSVPIVIIEPHINSFNDAIWWAVVTTTTVGYGDISPETGLGRIIAIILMVTGIGIIGAITGSVATYFTSNQKAAENSHISFIKSELDKYPNLTQEDFEMLIVMLNNLKQKAPLSFEKYVK